MLKKIYEWPHAVLKKTSEPIGVFNEETKQLAQDLIDTCNIMMGIGLAAPQIGLSKRMIVIDLKKLGLQQDDKNGINDDYWVLINPVIETEGDKIPWIEGCLSLPMVDGRVERFSKAKVTYMTIDGEQAEANLDWPASGGIQHECDHLDGIVYTFRQSRGNRARTLKKYWKLKKKAHREFKRLSNV